MKRCIFLLCLLLLLLSCQEPSKVLVTVMNPLPIDRSGEIVEVSWPELLQLLPALKIDNVVVTDAQGAQVPSQCIIEDASEPKKLIFQVTTSADAMAFYYISVGTREEYKTKATGRHVVERMDDYAWENNLTAYRVYGPALEVELTTMGVDAWSKNTTRMVTAKGEWFTRNYHKDEGEGMDCYKVGPTLGCGSTAPFADGQLWLAKNYTSQQTIANGPLRVTFKLSYDSLLVKDTYLRVEKIISLDADSYLNRVESRFYEVDSVTIAGGIVRHQIVSDSSQGQIIIFSELPSDSQKKDTIEDGLHHLALIAPSSQDSCKIVGNHSLILSRVASGEPVVCYTGAAWSKGQGSVATPEQWAEYVKSYSQKLAHPLEVTSIALAK